jgi:hypothetical protein
MRSHLKQENAVKIFSRTVSVAVHVFVWCVLAAIVLGILFAGLGAVAALHGAFSAS